jgi:hypothetical protein
MIHCVMLLMLKKQMCLRMVSKRVYLEEEQYYLVVWQVVVEVERVEMKDARPKKIDLVWHCL